MDTLSAVLRQRQQENISVITKRMRRKLDIMRKDREQRGDVTFHDVDELLVLLTHLERELRMDAKYNPDDIDELFNTREIGI
jgi:predicted RNA-binding protein (virulence factor B family)